jgi:6-pyruvoyltetrahydropterin/6-carboxytetrahydropterin synthase
MMSITATKQFQFDAAHMLSGHQGLCRNLHGHTYKVEVTVHRTDTDGLIRSGPSADMVVDFKELKNALNAQLFDKMDHAFIYDSWGGTEERELAELLKKWDMKVFDLCARPTAENMAFYFCNFIDTSILPTISDYLEVTKVKVWETPTSYAECRKEDLNGHC